MGNFTNKFIKNNITLQEAEANYEIVICHCYNNINNMATYRCSIDCPDDELIQIYMKYPKLKNYWSCTILDTIGFIACDKCIDPDYISIFAYYPDGWKEHINIKCYERYEEANIKY